MIFTTYWFCLFAGIFYPVYWLVRAPLWRLGLLLGACLVFHAHFAGAAGVLPIIVLGALTYLAGCWRRRWALYATIAVAATALVVYKYSHFITLDIVGAIDPALGRALDGFVKGWLPAAPPLAISFFTFEFVHYLHDVAKGSRPMTSPAQFSLFTFYFPSLVAGPIKRYQQFTESLLTGIMAVTRDDVKAGLLRIAVGFFKKVVIADNLTAAIAFWQPRYEGMTITGRWILVVAIGLRILMDFSGYSDIAIGLARLMGIRLPENFNWPYLARNLQEFWHRWHISLSTWIRDYIYIPLGGNRHGLARRAGNALLAFALCGLWHGPAWNFVCWGLLHGTGLVVSTHYHKVLGKPGRWIAAGLARVPVVSWAITTLFVFAGWLYFFHPVKEATQMLLLLFRSKL